jgi:hypothetical protein
MSLDRDEDFQRTSCREMPRTNVMMISMPDDTTPTRRVLGMGVLDVSSCRAISIPSVDSLSLRRTCQSGGVWEYRQNEIGIFSVTSAAAG